MAESTPTLPAVSKFPPQTRGFVADKVYPTSIPASLDIHHPKLPKELDEPLLTFIGASNGGVLYKLVYYSCCIIAGNCWDEGEGRERQGASTAYLSKHRDPNQPRLEIPEDGIIKLNDISKLYFHVPDGINGRHNDPKLGYSFTSCFEYWAFPDELPKPWQNLPPYSIEAPPVIPSKCSLTGYLNAVEAGYMIPKSVKGWFSRNSMRDRIKPISTHDVFYESVRNEFPVRADIHWLHDASIVVPFPYPVEDGRTELRACVAIQPRNQSTRAIWEVIKEYHNLPYRDLSWVPHHYIFARFAWTLFCTARMPILNGMRKQFATFYLSSYTEEDNKTQEGKWNTWDKNFPWPRRNYDNKPGFSDSPQGTKRGRDGNEIAADDDPRKSNSGLLSDDSDEESKSVSDSEHEQWIDAMKRHYGAISRDSDEESDRECDSEPEHRSEISKRNRCTVLMEQDGANEAARNDSPKRVRYPDHSSASLRQASSSHSSGSAEERGVLDLASSFGSNISTQVSKDGRSSKDSKSTASTKSSKSGTNKATQGNEIRPVFMSRDLSNSLDTSHYTY
ncbi:hypothetical protein F5Y06DRAFT_270386 [Hypoxylon sp. FL0890]|nr:hypothetical protein F5Y06DRAFT_270386 [Hypoxylon sp. FL0890]